MGKEKQIVTLYGVDQYSRNLAVISVPAIEQPTRFQAKGPSAYFPWLSCASTCPKELADFTPEDAIKRYIVGIEHSLMRARGNVLNEEERLAKANMFLKETLDARGEQITEERQLFPGDKPEVQSGP